MPPVTAPQAPATVFRGAGGPDPVASPPWGAARQVGATSDRASRAGGGTGGGDRAHVVAPGPPELGIAATGATGVVGARRSSTSGPRYRGGASPGIRAPAGPTASPPLSGPGRARSPQPPRSTWWTSWMPAAESSPPVTSPGAGPSIVSTISALPPATSGLTAIDEIEIPGLAEHRTDGADHPRPVVIADDQQVGAGGSSTVRPSTITIRRAGECTPARSRRPSGRPSSPSPG